MFSLTRGKETKCKGVVEEVDVHFCSENSSDKLELGDKDEEADEEGKECFWAKDFAPHHLCKKESTCHALSEYVWLYGPVKHRRGIILQYSNSKLTSQEEEQQEERICLF